MTIYRCYFVGRDDKIKSAEVIECPTDAAALEEAEQKLASSEHPVIEVWDKARRVGTVGHLKDHPGIAAQGRGASMEPAVGPDLTRESSRGAGITTRSGCNPRDRGRSSLQQRRGVNALHCRSSHRHGEFGQ